MYKVEQINWDKLKSYINWVKFDLRVLGIKLAYTHVFWILYDRSYLNVIKIWNSSKEMS